jgi:hypothetical protein
MVAVWTGPAWGLHQRAIVYKAKVKPSTLVQSRNTNVYNCFIKPLPDMNIETNSNPQKSAGENNIYSSNWEEGGRGPMLLSQLNDREQQDFVSFCNL